MTDGLPLGIEDAGLQGNVHAGFQGFALCLPGCW
jgi:hypothetical protein